MSARSFDGLGVCEGIAFGTVHVVDRRRLAAPRFRVAQDRCAHELQRFEDAIALSEAQLADLAMRASDQGFVQVRHLLEAHATILRDEALFDETRRKIEAEQKNAEWALTETVRVLKSMFDSLDQDYFRERRSDVDIVGDRVLRNLVGAETELLDNLSDQAIVVAYDLSPADALALAKFAARAFVTEIGGRTSHVAILARAMNVPCVLGVAGIMEEAGTGDAAIVDGYEGQVVLRPSEADAGRYRGLHVRHEKAERALLEDRDLPAETIDGVRVAVRGNIEVAQEVEQIVRYGVEGVGLYRTEFLCLERPGLEDAHGHFEAYRAVVSGMNGAPTTIRTFDLGGDKGFESAGAVGGETNPALGLRAIRLSLEDRDRFREQIEGILLASALGPVRLMLPLITSVEEVEQTRILVDEVKAKLDKTNRAYDPQLPVGVMIETPAAVFIVDRLLEVADFVSIGTNDLIQHALAADRGNERVAHLHRPCHPAVLRMIQHVVQVANSVNKPVGICGEAAGDPFYTALLLGLGLHDLSMTPKAVPLVKRLIRRLNAEDCRALAADACELPTTAEVEALAEARMRAWAPELFT